MSISMPQNDASVAPKRRFVMTDKRLAANRRNARKSTGPRTPAGKQQASQNGKPHPICSTDAFDRLEGTDVYGLHLAEMTKAFDPRNLMQAQLFPLLVALSWELTRMHESQVKLIERLREREDELPCEVIARVFASGEKNNPLVAHERYWRAKQNHYWRMVKQFEVLARWERSPEPNFQENWDAMLKREADARAAAVRQASRNRAEHVRRDEERIQREMERGEPIAPDENRDSGPETAVCATVAKNTNPLAEHRPTAEPPKPNPLPDHRGREEDVSDACGDRKKESPEQISGADVSPAILTPKRGRDARATKT